MFENYDHLGGPNPFYSWAGNQITLDHNFQSAFEKLEKPAYLDINAVVQMISRYHCFADRTLVRGLSRTPWMAKPNPALTAWEFCEVPPHDNKILPEKEIASLLFQKLQKEILGYTEGCSVVGILLSGGMDSRIVAGVLDYLLKTGQISAKIVAITWGMQKTRDVVYAQRIAKLMGWDWVHYPISAETLLNNINETAVRGCEYSPVHLHAIPEIREIKGVDCILAASYGDSIGRAEYSGRHITQLIPFEHYTMNWFKLLRVGIYPQLSPQLEQDITCYKTLFPRKEKYQQYEIDQQAHYMRRKLNHCMAVINEKVPLRQVFTDPALFGFMWSLSPEVRNDQVYKYLLGLLKPELADIPWARNGKRYLRDKEAQDLYSGTHHQYGQWIRNELYETISKKVLSSTISELNIFNMQALETILKVNRICTNQTKTSKADEILIWIAALSDFVKLYDIRGTASEATFFDFINGSIISPAQVAGLSLIKKIFTRQ